MNQDHVSQEGIFDFFKKNGSNGHTAAKPQSPSTPRTDPYEGVFQLIGEITYGGGNSLMKTVPHSTAGGTITLSGALYIENPSVDSLIHGIKEYTKTVNAIVDLYSKMGGKIAKQLEAAARYIGTDHDPKYLPDRTLFNPENARLKQLVNRKFIGGLTISLEGGELVSGGMDEGYFPLQISGDGETSKSSSELVINNTVELKRLLTCVQQDIIATILNVSKLETVMSNTFKKYNSREWDERFLKEYPGVSRGALKEFEYWLFDLSPWRSANTFLPMDLGFMVKTLIQEIKTLG